MAAIAAVQASCLRPVKAWLFRAATFAARPPRHTLQVLDNYDRPKIGGTFRDLAVQCSISPPADVAPPITVQVSVEATASKVSQVELDTVVDSIEDDALKLVQHSLVACDSQDWSYSVTTKPYELSIVLCDDDYMVGVNREWRGQARPTDVLSFEMPQDEFSSIMPVVLLGDIIISLDTAARQAKERQKEYGEGYTLYDEVRVLLVHGMLHLLGYDHERGHKAAKVMAEHEIKLMKLLGWKGRGLIEGVGVSSESGVSQPHGETPSDTTSELRDSDRNAEMAQPGADIKLVCLDMDGTLLNSASQIAPATADAVRQCIGLEDVTVMLATGKARPGAIAACSAAGLAGLDGLVHEEGPGVFLQGLATYGPDGTALPGPSLSRSVIATCFRFSEDSGTSCVAFLGDRCVTTQMTKYLKELHTRYYEPLAEVTTLDEILKGPKVKKILFMTEPEIIEATVMPQLEELMADTSAETTQAVDSMVEVVPEGVSKWDGISKWIEVAGLQPENVLAIGDGMNDYHMLRNAGVAVAVGNAKQPLKVIADKVVESNDADGVAKALQHYLLSNKQA